MVQQIKSWRSSRTIRGGIVTFLAATIPVLYNIYQEKEVNEGHLGILGTASVALYKVFEGRAGADTPIYTPNFLPGPNKPNIDEKLQKMADAASEKELEELFKYSNADFKSQVESPDESKSNGEVSPVEALNRPKNIVYTIKPTRSTYLKSSTTDSSLLENLDKQLVTEKDTLYVKTWAKNEINHIEVTLEGSKDLFYLYIPHIKLYNKEGNLIGLADNTDKIVRKQIDEGNKTAIYLPNVGDFYLEDPIYPGSHFTISEFTRGGERLPSTKAEFDKAVESAKVLDRIRKHFGNLPVVITSWLRPYAVNLAVGGSSNSRHLYGDGVDFYINGIPEWDIVDYVSNFHKGGIAARPGSFVHVDSRGYYATWVY